MDQATQDAEIGILGNVIPVSGWANAGAPQHSVITTNSRHDPAGFMRACMQACARDVLEEAFVRALNTWVHRFAIAKVRQKIFDVIGIECFDARQMEVDEGRVGVGLMQQVRRRRST